MNKKKRILFTLIIALLCTCILFTAFACNKGDETSNSNNAETEEEGLLFTNGNFKLTSGNSYPKTPNDWTGVPGSTSTSTQTPQEAKDLSAGVISTGSDYSQSTFGAANPGAKGEDKNVLMINNKTATSYAYKSSSASIKKDNYYLLTLWVKTYQINTDKDGTGAYIQVYGDAYIDFEAIKTDDWKQIKVYLRGSNDSDKSINLALGLGTGNSSTGIMTSGFAYFDDVVLTNLTDVEEGETAFTEENFNSVQLDEYTKKYDLRTIDRDFNYSTSTSSIPYTASQFTGQAGKGTGDEAPSSSTYVQKGIMDISAVDGKYEFSGLNLATGIKYDLKKVNENDEGDRFLFIHNKKLTAYSYKDTVGMYIGVRKYYKISVYVLTASENNGGATVSLIKDNETLSNITNISTNGEWQKVTFYIEGNQYASNTINLCLSLGIGGQGDQSKWSQGIAFFDNFSYEEISESDYTSASVDAITEKYSYKTEENDLTLVDLSSIKSTQYNEAFLNEDKTLKNTTIEIKNDIVTNLKNEAEQNLPVLVIKNTKPTAFSASTIIKDASSDAVDVANSTFYTIAPNKAYEISFWVKIEDQETGLATITISLVKYDDEQSDKYASCTSSLTSAKLTAANLADFAVEEYDGYARVSMYILGAEINSEQIGINIEFGTGETTTNNTSFSAGEFYMTALRMNEVDYTTYSGVSTNTVTYRTSLVGSADSSEVSSNGNFNFIDISATNSLYKDSTQAGWESAWDASDKLINTASPTNWTITDSASLIQNGGNVMAGVININDFAHYAELPGTIDASTFYDGMPINVDLDKNPNALMISVPAGAVNYLGYKSNSISLSADSYYAISIYARVLEGEFSINITPATSDGIKTLRVNATDVGTDWRNYTFLFRTGINSSGVNVSICVGSPKNTDLMSIPATVFFANTSYSTITKEIYESYEDAVNGIEEIDKDNYALVGNRTIINSLFIDTMDTTNSTNTEDLKNPSDWSGTKIDSNAVIDADTATSGLFNQLSSNWDKIDIDPDAEDSFRDKMYASEKYGDSMLVIYNKKFTTYSYSSTSFTLRKGVTYKISIDILTKDIKYMTKADKEKDYVDSKYDDYKTKELLNSATITLNVNNKNYSFGKALESNKEESLEGAELNEYLLTKDRQVNKETWTTYSYYITLDDDIEDSVSAKFTIALGGKNFTYWASGYVFADNFTVEEIDKEAFDAISDDTLDKTSSSYDSSIASNTYKITYTNADATAEEEKDDEEENTNNVVDPTKNELLWLYITSGVIGGVIVVVIIVYLIKKFSSKNKKKIKKAKKTTLTDTNSSINQFKD